MKKPGTEKLLAYAVHPATRLPDAIQHSAGFAPLPLPLLPLRSRSSNDVTGSSTAAPTDTPANTGTNADTHSGSVDDDDAQSPIITSVVIIAPNMMVDTATTTRNSSAPNTPIHRSHSADGGGTPTLPPFAPLPPSTLQGESVAVLPGLHQAVDSGEASSQLRTPTAQAPRVRVTLPEDGTVETKQQQQQQSPAHSPTQMQAVQSEEKGESPKVEPGKDPEALVLPLDSFACVIGAKKVTQAMYYMKNMDAAQAALAELASLMHTHSLTAGPLGSPAPSFTEQAAREHIQGALHDTL